MKYFILLLNVVLLSSCQTTSADYEVRSVAEARAYARRAVELGVVSKGGEAALIAEKSEGLPQEGKYNPGKINNFLSQYAADHPRLIEINRAANEGKISENERVILVNVLKGQEERLAEQKIAEEKEKEDLLDQAATMNSQGSSYRQNSALMQSTPTSSYTGYGTGFGGRSF